MRLVFAAATAVGATAAALIHRKGAAIRSFGGFPRHAKSRILLGKMMPATGRTFHVFVFLDQLLKRFAAIFADVFEYRHEPTSVTDYRNFLPVLVGPAFCYLEMAIF